MYPLTTEKTKRLSSGRTYVFAVSSDENKIEIGGEVERLYKVKVKQVNIIWKRSKRRRLGRIEGRQPGFKKAIVTLKEGYTIEV